MHVKLAQLNKEGMDGRMKGERRGFHRRPWLFCCLNLDFCAKFSSCCMKVFSEMRGRGGLILPFEGYWGLQRTTGKKQLHCYHRGGRLVGKNNEREERKKDVIASADTSWGL